MLTIQVKNTTLHLNGQNLKLEAKNGRASKTPGHHLSVSQGKEAAGRLAACSPTHKGTPQLDLLLKTPRPHLERGVENQQVRRPLALAPLELPEKVREAQRQKLKLIQQEAKPTSCKLDATVNETLKKSAISCARQKVLKPPVCPSASGEPLKSQNRFSRPQLTRSNPAEPNTDWSLEGVVCRGTPAPLHNKPASLLPSLRFKAPGACGPEEGRQSSSARQQETGRRRLRLRRAQCLEEDQHITNPSTGGLSAEKDKPSQGVQAKGQQAERAPEGRRHTAKGIKQPPADSWERAGIRRGHQAESSRQSTRFTLRRQSAEGGSGECAHEGVKPGASHWRLKSRKNVIHNNAAPCKL